MSIKNKYIGILLTATMMLLSACSSDDPEAQTVTTGKEPVGKVVQLVSYASPFTDKELSHRAAPAGFSAYTPDKTTSMGIYMLLSENPAVDWANPKEEKIIYNSNKWHAFFDVTPDKTYTVYGYMPKSGEMSSTLTKSAADAATLTITGIKPVTTELQNSPADGPPLCCSPVQLENRYRLCTATYHQTEDDDAKRR